MSFNISSNNLSTAVYQFLDYIQSNRVVSTTGKLNIYDTDGGIMTEKTANWSYPPYAEKAEELGQVHAFKYLLKSQMTAWE